MAHQVKTRRGQGPSKPMLEHPIKPYFAARRQIGRTYYRECETTLRQPAPEARAAEQARVRGNATESEGLESKDEERGAKRLFNASACATEGT